MQVEVALSHFHQQLKQEHIALPCFAQVDKSPERSWAQTLKDSVFCLAIVNNRLKIKQMVLIKAMAKLFGKMGIEARDQSI